MDWRMTSLSPIRTRVGGVLAILFMLLGVLSCGGSGSTSTVGPVAKITISPATATIANGQTQSFFPVPVDANGNSVTGLTLTWTSSATSVATVDSNGVATGVTNGTSQITVSASGITSNSATLTVTTKVASIAISPMSTTVAVGATRPFTATALDPQGNAISGVNVSWFCSFSGTATIDNNGVATGVAPGTVTIVANVGSVTSQPATLTVTP
jgi:uncharacterized protein YjdB